MVRGKFALILALMASQAAWADLTIRYEFDVKLGNAIPAQVKDMVQAQIGTMFPNGLATRVRGRQCSSSFGPVTSIINGDTKEVTLLNPSTHQFAVIPVPDVSANFADQIQLPPQAADFFKNLNIKADVSKPGQTATIQGIQAEDNLVTISLEIPGPAGPPIAIRFEMHDWLPAAGEVDRVGALKELSDCSSAASSNIDPREMLDKLLAMFPGMQEKLGDAVKLFADRKNGPAMKVHMAIYVPALALLLPPQPGQAAVDPSAPLMEMDMNLVEFSQSPIPDSAFTVPPDYKSAPVDELMKSFQPGFGLPAAPPAPARGGRAQAEPAGAGGPNPTALVFPAKPTGKQ